MTSSESKGIHIEIATPSQTFFPTRVYSIPKNQDGVYTPIKLRVRIIDNTSNTLYLNPCQPFIPELLTSDGQTIQGHIVTEEIITNTQQNIPIEGNQGRRLERREIRPKVSTGFSLIAKLFWQNNSLKLKIPAISDYWLDSINCNSFWCFDALEAKSYQLRFILNIDCGTTYVSESDIRKEENPRENNSVMLATPWLNLRLVQPLSTDSNAIEVDGVKFKIEMPESTFKITRVKTNVKLGIHVTNNTSTALRFYQASSVDIILLGDDGKEINSQSDPPRNAVSKEPQYYSVQPGKSAFFDLEAMLLWDYEQDLDTNMKETWFLDKNLTPKRRYSDNKRGFRVSPKVQIELAIPNKTRHRFNGGDGFDYFPDLKVGASYQLQVIYHVSEQARNLEEQVLEKVWVGWIAMPFVEFSLVK